MDNRPTPKIITVYGFLGSGKTTVMLQLARQIVDNGHRAAIVVNEAGEIPIDGKMLEIAGLPVKEIFAGCICCSMVGDLVKTLKALITSSALSYILIEPSGMADAGSLFDSVEKHASPDLVKLLILDGPRLPLLLKAAKNLISGQLEEAGLVLLNKTDAMSPAQIEDAICLLADLPHGSAIHRVIGSRPLDESLIREIL